MTIFRYRDAALANTSLFIYIIVGVIATVVGAQLMPAWTDGFSFWIFCGSILLGFYLGHILVLAAYLAHECMHNTIFKQPKFNDYLGASLAWSLGAAYQPYPLLKEKHLRHHTERRDVLSIDYRQHLLQSPRLLRWIKTLQWCHVPAAEIYTHLLSIASPFYLPQKKHLRSRVLLVAITRLGFYIVLYQISPVLLFASIVASLFCLLVLGFMDAYQHTYTLVLALDKPKARSPFGRDYEEQHTFTNLISKRYSWLNLFVLNFCYHNVHHWKSGEPWYRLPKLHQQRYGDHCDTYIPFVKQIAYYHQYRTLRIDPNRHQADADSAFIGAAGVSFLVGV